MLVMESVWVAESCRIDVCLTAAVARGGLVWLWLLFTSVGRQGMRTGSPFLVPAATFSEQSGVQR